MSGVAQLLAVAALTAAASAPAVRAAEPGKSEYQPTPAELDFFEKKVRPVLATHCYKCHPADAEKLKANLRLDSRFGWMTGGDSGAAIVPGEPDKSLLIKAIRYRDTALQMPPTGRLPEKTIADIEQWVEMGAPDPRLGGGTPKADEQHADDPAATDHWAFQPPQARRPPAVDQTDWPLTDIDRFILARLESKNIAPPRDADRRTLIRRLYFDLTGLPPTPAEVAAFESDTSQIALENVVDRLVDSPRFGEQWGRHWLDLARYADTNGGDFNATFYNAWRYRDYVIAAFNNDKPFDRFVVEQIAGDKLFEKGQGPRAEGQGEEQGKGSESASHGPSPTALSDSLIATGYLMLGAKMLSERDKEKLAMDVVDEQLDTIGKTFMGLTLGCARCHDHKFDPVTMRDYYAMAGIFRSTQTLDGEIQKYVSDWVRRDLPLSGEHAAALAAYEKRQGELKSQIGDTKKAIDALKKQLAADPANIPGVVVDDTETKRVGSWKDSTYSPMFFGKGYIHDDKQGKGEKSVTWTPDIPKTGEYEVRISYAASTGRDRNVPLTIRHAEGEKKITVDQEPIPPIDKLWRPIGRFRFEKGRNEKTGSVTLSTEGTTEYVIADAAHFVPVERIGKDGQLLADDGSSDDADPQQDDRRKQLKSAEAELKKLEESLKELEKNAPPPAPKALAVQDAKEIADTAIRVRGEPHQYGPVVPRGFIEILHSPGQTGNTPPLAQDDSGRLQFAAWIASPDNPLTARVIVNRVWQRLLGDGLVRSVDNFGLQGDTPSHPELLDTLAVEFMHDGWSVKRLVRRIVTSRVYAIASDHRDDAFAADPENRLLWRANRRRLDAEEMRDAMLAIAGSLDVPEDRAAGGPVVADLPRLAVNNNAQGSAGVSIDDNTQRSVYLPLVRNFLPEVLTVFDFAERDMTVGKRPVTNVPAQALFLMNSPFVQKSARRVAESLLADDSLDDAARVARAYERVLGRPAGDDDIKRALAYIAGEAGQSERQAEGVNADELTKHAWTRFVQALFASTQFRMID